MSTDFVTTHPADAAVPTEHLLDKRQRELDVLFANLEPLSVGEVDGNWRGMLMAIGGIQRLPRPVARVIYRVNALPFMPWAGKSFDGDTGANRFFWVRGPSFLRYTVETVDSPVDGQPVLFLNYDRPDNPAPARRIRGEVRRLGTGVLLARMNWKTRRGQTRLLYFTLTDPRRW